VISLRQRIRPTGSWPWPRWRYARSGPHKTPGVERRFLNQVSRAPSDCQAIFDSPTRKHHRPIGVFFCRPANLHAAAIAIDGCSFAMKASLWRSTAQAIRASLLASATTATFLWTLASNPFSQRPSDV
jgi:hypothetical protein